MTTETQRGKRRHLLLPKEIRAKLPALREQDGKGEDATAFVKFFSPYSRYTLYVTEFDGEDTLFGYVESPLGEVYDEWGYSSLAEIEEATVFGSVPAIERDCGFTPAPVKGLLGR
jgi:hypothetical protein